MESKQRNIPGEAISLIKDKIFVSMLSDKWPSLIDAGQERRRT